MNQLRHKHTGETCWIVGKGPSLRYLRAEHFGPGPVIALNDAIVAVQELDIPNKVYSLQKDGQPGFMVKPRMDIALIVQKNYPSQKYYPEHPERYVVDVIKDLGFDHIQVLATRMAIAIAKQMDCSALKMMCCDNLVTGALETFNPRTGNAKVTGAAHWYQLTRPYILKDLESVQHEFIIPIDMARENMRSLHGDNTR